jgi:hypothetical protein
MPPPRPADGGHPRAPTRTRQHALAGEVLLHRLETTAAERNVIDDT